MKYLVLLVSLCFLLVSFMGCSEEAICKSTSKQAVAEAKFAYDADEAEAVECVAAHYSSMVKVRIKKDSEVKNLYYKCEWFFPGDVMCVRRHIQSMGDVD